MSASLRKVTLDWDEENRPKLSVEYFDPDEDDGKANADEWLEALGNDASATSALLLRTLLDHNERSGDASLDELADESGQDRGTVRGWSRNLGRTVNRLCRDYGMLRPDRDDGTAQLLDFRRDGEGSWHYLIPAEFREALSRALDARKD